MFFPVNYFLAGSLRDVRIKGRITSKHFKQNYSKGPPINSLIIAIRGKHFRSYIIRSSNCWISFLNHVFNTYLLVDDIKFNWELLFSLDFSNEGKSAFLHSPKSDNLMCPLLSIRTLSGFRSLWIKLILWTESTAKTSSAK